MTERMKRGHGFVIVPALSAADSAGFDDFIVNTGSVPFISLRILERCCTRIKTGTMIANAARLQLDSEKGDGDRRNNSTAPNTIAAHIELSDTNRDSAKTEKKTTAATKTLQGLSMMSTPNEVATPLPPRKPSQQGNMWPMMVKIPATTWQCG